MDKNTEQLCLVMEFVEGGNLAKYLRDKQPNERKRMTIAAEIANGMEYIHSMGLVHRDLNLENILV
jgi:3-phosphoinositide dependent protein kinase-1